MRVAYIELEITYMEVVVSYFKAFSRYSLIEEQAKSQINRSLEYNNPRTEVNYVNLLDLYTILYAM